MNTSSFVPSQAGMHGKIVNRPKSILAAIFLLSSSFLYPIHVAAAQVAHSPAPCWCVIFRLDDIQVGYLNHVQVQIIDTFLQRHASIAIGIIGNDFENDKVVLPYLKEKLREDSSQIEIANHGWMHEDFSRLDVTKQMDLMQRTNNEISSLFGIHPVVFIPPFNKFNGDTLISAHRLGFEIFSSSIYFDNSNYFTSGRLGNTGPQMLHHLPAMVDFSQITSGSWSRIPNEQIIDTAEKDIVRYGYSVILLHPENFAMQQDQGYIDVIDPKQTSDLAKLIDLFRSKNIQITTFSSVTGLGKLGATEAVPEFGQSASYMAVAAVAVAVVLSKRITIR